MSRSPKGAQVRHPPRPPCTAVSYPGFLTCDLHLAGHKMHHDPAGLWWTPCTLPDHAHHGKEGR